MTIYVTGLCGLLSLSTLMFSLVPTFNLSSPLSSPSLVFKGNYHLTSVMSKSYTSVVSQGAWLGWMKFLTDKDEQPSSAISSKPSDTAAFETGEFFCILNVPNSSPTTLISHKPLLCYFKIKDVSTEVIGSQRRRGFRSN